MKIDVPARLFAGQQYLPGLISVKNTLFTEDVNVVNMDFSRGAEISNRRYLHINFYDVLGSLI